MRSAVPAVLAIASAVPAYAGSGIIGLGHLNATDRTSGTAISDDGNFVTGFSANSVGLPVYTPLRWSISGAPTLQQLAFPAGWASAQPTGISSNGSVVSGWRQQGSEFPGFRWAQGTGSAALSNPAGWSQVRTRDVSPDGSTVAGSASISGVGFRAVRWVGTNPGSPLPLPAGYTGSSAATFDNLGRLFGSARDSGGVDRMVRWTGDTMEVLASFGSNVNLISGPFKASADGTTIAGLTSHQTINPPRDDGWVWTAALGFTPIPVLPGLYTTHITDISADGSIVLGVNFDAGVTTQAPFVWTRDRGTLPLAQFLTEAGVDLAGWTIGSATGISADGTKIVGTGLSPAGRAEAFVAIIPAPTTALALGGGALLASSRRRRGL